MSNDQSGQVVGNPKSHNVVVNGRPREVSANKLSYLQVVQLAFPNSDDQPNENRVYTVTYSNPNGHEGSLVDGQELEIKEGVVINVRKTDKS